MDNRNQKIFISIIAILLLFTAIWLIKLAFYTSQPEKINLDSTTISIISTSTTSTVPQPTTKKTILKPALNYGELIKKFNGYRFQFSNNCSQISPFSLVIKSGSQFMIDNRENKNHVFTFSQQKYYVKPFSYAIVTTKNTGEQHIFCDGIQRATVNVAK